MDPKLAILFMLIGAVIGLSHLSEANLTRMRRQLVRLRWRDIGPGPAQILGGGGIGPHPIS